MHAHDTPAEGTINDIETIRTFIHALNNQLGVVVGSLSLIESSLQADPERAKRILALAQDGAKKMTELIKNYREQLPKTESS
jgi:DNA-binding IclR family transcriptional regulator